MTKTKVLNLSTATEPVTIKPYNDAAVTYLPNKEKWRLEKTFVWFDEVKRCRLTLRDGFLFDLASISRLVWILIAPFELGTAPPAAHDGLYQSGGKNSAWLKMEYTDSERAGEEVIYTRAEADDLFRRLMIAKEVVTWRLRLAYRAVRLRGHDRWKGEKCEKRWYWLWCSC